MMRSFISASTLALLITPFGYSDTIITAKDYAVDSDVVLESAVEVVKETPRDTLYMVDDAGKFIVDEAEKTAAGFKAAISSSVGPHDVAQIEGEQAIKDAWDTSDNIEFRSYKVSKRLGDLLQAYVVDKTATAVDVAEFFKAIEFPEGTVAQYLPEFQSLLVHQTPDNLLDIEAVLASYQRVQKDLMGRQVEIEVKFIEISEKTFDELGFRWSFDGKNGQGDDLRLFDNLYLPAPQDVFSSGLRGAAAALGGGPAAGTLEFAKTGGTLNWSVVIDALEQTTDSDVLSSPRVVTHSHETAVIQVGEERMVPKAFEIDNQNTSPYVQHSGWELELMGVKMEVTPEIRRDGLIDLELSSQILDYIGDDTYRIAPELQGTFGISVNKGGSTATMNEINASLPYFRIRSLETRVTVDDGNTIAMGGLIYDKLETFRDKIPVLGSIPWLGRLFRSEGERSVKRNLMIFVTATQVDVNGRRAADLALEK